MIQTPKPLSLRERCRSKAHMWAITPDNLEAFAQEIEAEAYARGQADAIVKWNEKCYETGYRAGWAGGLEEAARLMDKVYIHGACAIRALKDKNK